MKCYRGPALYRGGHASMPTRGRLRGVCALTDLLTLPVDVATSPGPSQWMPPMRPGPVHSVGEKRPTRLDS